MANIVIYGSEISGLCAAFKLSGNLRNDDHEKHGHHNIYIIVTNPSKKLGGLATMGALNGWDVYIPNGSRYNDYIQKGTFRYLYNKYHHNFKTLMAGETDYGIADDMKPMADELEDIINRSSSEYVNIEIIRAMDLTDVEYAEETGNIKNINRIYLRSIYKADNGYIKWGKKTKYIDADYFIDASDDGKLTSFVTPVTVGRYDWPESYNGNSLLDNCEQNSEIPVARQQAATLYFRILESPTEDNPGFENDDLPWNNPEIDGVTFVPTNKAYEFDTNTEWYDKTNFYLKGYNCARNSHSRDIKEYWVNTNLIFDVDGRAHYRDIITPFFPKHMLSDSWIRDKAWVYAKNYISGKLPHEMMGGEVPSKLPPKFIDGLYGFKRMKNCQLVSENETDPEKIVVAEQLYIRESVHLPSNPNSIGNGTEMSNYAIKRDHTLKAGVGDLYNDGADKDNYNTRIGLGCYATDIHPYKKSDLLEKTADGFVYHNGKDSYKYMRPDVTTEIDAFLRNPVYLPYEAIHTDKVSNLLVVGNAISCCSFSWGEIRVLSNLCVFGDAAGIILAYCIRNDKNLTEINKKDPISNEYLHMNNIHDALKSNDSATWWSNNVLIDKSPIN